MAIGKEGLHIFAGDLVLFTYEDIQLHAKIHTFCKEVKYHIMQVIKRLLITVLLLCTYM